MTPKDLLLTGAQSIGMFSLVGHSSWRRARLLILCYHGISTVDEHEWNPELYITQQKLRERLTRLKKGGYTILPLTEALEKLRGGTLPPGAVALTFDDGPCDFAERAVPVLREFSAPATVYLTTYYCEHRYPVFDPTLAYLLWRGRDSGREVVEIGVLSEPLHIRTTLERSAAWKAITGAARQKQLDTVGKHNLLGVIAKRIGVDFEAFINSRILQIMTPEQVRNLPRDLIDVQLHTHRHRTPRNESSFMRELQDNQASIAAMTGIPAHRAHFCYPSGDYAVVFLDWLRRFGIESATTCIPGLASQQDEFLLLPRFVDSMSVSDLAFDAWASGFAEVLPHRSAHRLNPQRP